MTVAQRLKALAEKHLSRACYRGPVDPETERVENHKTGHELRAIIAALARERADDRKAILEVACEMDMVHIGTPPSTRMRTYAARLRAIAGEKP